MAAGRHLGNFRMAISVQRIIGSTTCLFCMVFGVGGSNVSTSVGPNKRSRPSILNGHISETVHPIHFVEKIMRQDQ